MHGPDRYPVPGRRHRVDDHVRRSRFITTLARARTGEEAEAFIHAVRAEFPDATRVEQDARPEAPRTSHGTGGEGSPGGGY